MSLTRASKLVTTVFHDTAALRSLSTKSELSTFKLPDLDYDYAALEPYISADIMELHHSKHHQTYLNNLNASLEKLEKAERNNDVAEMIALQDAIKFNGGGHVNHSIFWKNLAPAGKGGGGEPTGELADLINKKFGSFETFKSQFATRTAAVQGSGWGWLGYNKATGEVEHAACANQDPLSTKGLVPLLGVDVWEHAYYLQYRNVRPDYLKAIWNVVNWDDVAERLKVAKSE